MPPTYTLITLVEMHDYLAPQQFVPVQVPRCGEVVYSKLVAKNMCVRVFTSIPLYQYASRGVGGDAIRVCLVRRAPDGVIYGIGKAKRVHRTQGWKENTQRRIDEMARLAGEYVSAQRYAKGA